MKQSIPLVGLTLLIACQNKQGGNEQKGPFIDTIGMDKSINPGDNFFDYANGNWLKNTKIPDDQSGWGSFYVLGEDNLNKLKGIVEEAQKSNAKQGSIQQKIGDFYTSAMDTTTINKLDAQPLQESLKKIDAIKSLEDLKKMINELSKTNQQTLINFYVGADEKNSVQNIVTFTQSGTTLPEKEYYFSTDSASNSARTALLTYAKQMFSFCGADEESANSQAKTILSLETEIAKSHRTPVELRNPQKNYNKMTLAQFQQTIPDFNLNDYFANLGAKVDSVNIGQPEYFKSLSTLLKSQALENWKIKLKFDIISATGPFLSKRFVDAQFAFSKTFSGQKKQSDRWKRIVRQTDNNMGDLLGQLYVEKYFTPEAKNRMDELVSNLQKVFAQRIEKLEWMSPETKKKANEKLHLFLKKIGYPSVWKKYDDVTISKDNYFANILSLNTHNIKEQLDKIGKKVDRNEWQMTAPTVNAYYNPTFNEIVFPAGILQPPFFYTNADDAVNYGAIGAVIGHEMTHGFDDQGRQYDAYGNMKDWWSKSDADKFKEKADKVIAKYNSFTVLDNQHVNGSLTLGENLADIGGLAIAYDAYKLTQQGKTESSKKIDGFTDDQRFFLGFAQVWRIKNRDERLRSRLKIDPHSPEEYRVNGTVYNMESFYKAFDIKPENKMYLAPKDRLGVW